MTDFHGTDASEVLIGTSGDDVFYSSKGQDILDGAAGWDKAIIDYSAAGAGQSRAHNVFYLYDGLYGAFTGDVYPGTETVRIEELDVKTSEASDVFYLDFTQISTPWKVSIDAGGGTGFDVVTLRLSSSPALVGTVVNGSLASGNLSLTGFEQFDLHLAGGNDNLTLAAGWDTVDAGGGNDFIDGGTGDDRLEGGAGGDTLRGGEGDDLLYADDDYLAVDLGSEIDNLNGGAGNDLVSIGFGDSADGGTGVDRLSLSLLGGTTGVVLDLGAMFAGGTATFGGGTIKGFETYSIIYGTNFADTINTGNAASTGGFGSPGIYGYDGDDRITTGNQADTAGGGGGNDILRVGAGSDRASGDDGNDQVFGEAGDDSLFGGEGDDIVFGGDGIDTIFGGGGVDRLVGEGGDDVLDGEGGDDLLEGGIGNDQLTGGFGNDNLQGGAGDDVYKVDAGDTVVEAAGAGNDSILTEDASYSLAGLANVENLVGWFADQILTGNAASNRIDGGLGADTMTGGAGNDIYFVDNDGDRTIESAGGGTDEVRSSISWALEDHVENLLLTGFSDLDGVGNDLVNTIVGNSGSNILLGEGGNDSISGGEGIDILMGGLGADILDGGTDPNGYLYFAMEESAGASVDTIKAFKTGFDLIDVSAALALSVSWTFADGVSTVTVETVYGPMTIKVEGVVAQDDFLLAEGIITGTSADDTLQGTDEADIIFGGTGADTMTGGAGDDYYFVDNFSDNVVEAADGGVDGVESTFPTYTLGANVEYLILTGFIATEGIGNDLDNLIFGSDAANTLSGRGGDDLLDGGLGADKLLGGLGNDIYFVDHGGDVVTEDAGAGTDEVLTDLAAYTLTANVEYLTGAAATGQTLTGNALANFLTGGDGNDRLDGGLGSDQLEGGLGDDVYIVAAGDTVIEAAFAGIDEVRTALATYTLGADLEKLTGTSAAGQTLTGNGLANVLTGGAGNDSLDGGLGDDTMAGGLGNDVYRVDAPGDVIVETGGTDEVRTGMFDYSLAEGVENLTGTAFFSQTLRGNALGNLISGGDAGDSMIGGDGNDVYLVGAGDFVQEFFGQGSDEVRTSLANYSLGGNVERLTGTSTAGQYLTGNELANTISGGAGNDQIDGGLGADQMSGGGGNDLYTVDAGDVVTEAANAGIDEVRTDLAAYTLTANVEKLSGFAFLGQSLTGNALANTVTGSGGGDRLDGGAGADVLRGGAGDDVYVVDNGGDQLIELTSDGIDTVESALSFTLAADFENLTLTGAAAINGTGNALANMLTGNAGANLLNGGGGEDAMAGGLGNDVYIVDAGDVVTETANAGTDEVRTSLAAYALAANVERLAGTSAAGQALTGNALANGLTGGGGNDLLDGGAGADQMAGGLGNDVYFVDAGDVVTEAANAGTDEIRTTLVNSTLAANAENFTGLLNTGQTLRGNALGNVFAGGAGADRMVGGLGNDIYLVGAGDNVIESSGAGSDEVRTALAVYTLTAEVERLTGTSATGQTLTGNALANVIAGGAGNDILNGGLGGDQMAGGLGNDVYFVDPGNSVAEAADGGIDEIRTTIGNSTLSANVENFTGLLNTGQTLRGNALGNLFAGGSGADRFVGGAGDDVYLVGTGDNVIESAGAGTDEVRTGVAAYTLTAEVERLIGTSSTGQKLTGNALANVISGGAGNDVLNGGLGADEMAGGLGNDVYFVEGGDSVAEAANAGTDEVRTAIANSTAGANIENLTGLLNTGQTLRGNALNNLIAGGAGADLMIGGLGNDVYLVGAGDTVAENAGEGIDEVRTALSAYTLGADIERLTGTSAAGQALTGNGLANVITGGASKDVLNGGLGADQMVGGLGNDVYFVDAGNSVTEATNAGIDEIRTTIADSMAGANIENLTGLLHTGQTLRGNALGNLIAGGTGADRMVGGLGDDVYVVGAGDNVIEKVGEGADEVRTALASYTLTAEVEQLTGTSASAQTLTGNALANVITGGAGVDTLAGGGGADAFRYLAVTESNAASRDHIIDFTPGTDKIELDRIDASRAIGGDQAFTWIGSNAFSKTAGELRATQSGAQWIVEGDINGDGFADLVIALTLQGPTPLGAGDFVL